MLLLFEFPLVAFRAAIVCHGRGELPMAEVFRRFAEGVAQVLAGLLLRLVKSLREYCVFFILTVFNILNIYYLSVVPFQQLITLFW